jgi:hypothetical protein
LKVLYLQEFNGTGQNPICTSLKGNALRKKVFEIMPKLRGLDGYRQSSTVFEPGQLDDESDNLQYSCDEEWFSPDIYLTTTIGKDVFNKSTQSSKEEIDFK